MGIIDNNVEQNRSIGALSVAESSSTSGIPSCAICLEALEVGDAVSWGSAAPQSSTLTVYCDHVFHHECIREWLLRKIQCPCCRRILLPVDDAMSSANDFSSQSSPPQEDSPVTHDDLPTHWLFSARSLRKKRGVRPRIWTQPELRRLALHRDLQRATTYYCLQEGVVRLPQDLLVYDPTVLLAARNNVDTADQESAPQGSLARLFARFWRSPSSRQSSKPSDATTAVPHGNGTIASPTKESDSDRKLLSI